MSFPIFKKLRIDARKQTIIALQLAKVSIDSLEGKIEDVYVKVDKFIFTVDFVILDYKAN